MNNRNFICKPTINMQNYSLRKISSHRALALNSNKKPKRLVHIKSDPSCHAEIIGRGSYGKVDHNVSQVSNKVKIKKIRTQQQLKSPHFMAVKTARQRHYEKHFTPKITAHKSSNKSLTKSTQYRSPIDKDQTKSSKEIQSRSKKYKRNKYTNMIKKVKEVVEEYQLTIQKCQKEKQEVLKENQRLKQLLQVKTKRYKHSALI